jgi:hypothetical protein
MLAGAMIAVATTAVSIIALRQPSASISTVASGVMIIGATPAPSETSDTARLRFRSNQPRVVAISGAKKAPPEAPTSPP